MGPLTYSLCKKPVLGLIMYVTSACAFPPLFWAEPLPLQQASASFVKEFDAPVSKLYFLLLHFQFASTVSSQTDEVVGSLYNGNCNRDYADIPESQRAGLGRKIPIHVLIREQETGTIIIDRVFNSLCKTSAAASGLEKTRTVGQIYLATGKYVAEIHNLASQAGLDDVKTTVSLVSGNGK